MEKMRCILKYMIAVLFMIIMMCCTGTSFTVYAAGEWTVDGDAKDYVYIPGGTYWAVVTVCIVPEHLLFRDVKK